MPSAESWELSGNQDSQYGRDEMRLVTWRQNVKVIAPGVNTQDNYYWYDNLQQVRQHQRGTLAPAGPPPYSGINSPHQTEVLTYDALTRRVAKTTAGEARHYYYDRQWRSLQERVGGTTKTDYAQRQPTVHFRTQDAKTRAKCRYAPM